MKSLILTALITLSFNALAGDVVEHYKSDDSMITEAEGVVSIPMISTDGGADVVAEFDIEQCKKTEGKLTVVYPGVKSVTSFSKANLKMIKIGCEQMPR